MGCGIYNILWSLNNLSVGLPLKLFPKLLFVFCACVCIMCVSEGGREYGEDLVVSDLYVSVIAGRLPFCF